MVVFKIEIYELIIYWSNWKRQQWSSEQNRPWWYALEAPEPFSSPAGITDGDCFLDIEAFSTGTNLHLFQTKYVSCTTVLWRIESPAAPLYVSSPSFLSQVAPPGSLDISYDVHHVAPSISALRSEHPVALKRILQYIKGLLDLVDQLVLLLIGGVLKDAAMEEVTEFNIVPEMDDSVDTKVGMMRPAATSRLLFSL